MDLTALAEFLRARINEDSGLGVFRGYSERLLARVRLEAESKRQILWHAEHMLNWTADHQPGVTEHEIRQMQTAGARLLTLLASVYADHPEFRPEWKP